MTWNSMLGEHMNHEKIGELFGSDFVVARDENCLFRRSIDDNEDGGIFARSRELFDEVHRDGIPRSNWNWERFEETIRSVTMWFIATASST